MCGDAITACVSSSPNDEHQVIICSFCGGHILYYFMITENVVILHVFHFNHGELNQIAGGTFLCLCDNAGEIKVYLELSPVMPLYDPPRSLHGYCLSAAASST